jgi:hypothetical protein
MNLCWKLQAEDSLSSNQGQAVVLILWRLVMMNKVISLRSKSCFGDVSKIKSRSDGPVGEGPRPHLSNTEAEIVRVLF